jgi:hypothetical protein
MEFCRRWQTWWGGEGSLQALLLVGVSDAAPA